MTVQISWIAEEVTTLASGGDSVEVTFETLRFDGSERESYDTEATATEHPVEDDADITDHVRPHLRRMEFEVLMSAHPGPGAEGSLPAGGFDPSVDRSGFARAIVDSLIRGGIEVDIDTEVRSYESVLLLGCSESRSAQRGDGFRARLTAREFRRVSTEEVEAPAPRVERGRRRADRGRHGGERPDVDENDLAEAIERVLEGDSSAMLEVLRKIPGSTF